MTSPPQKTEGETDSGKIGAHRLLVARYGCPRVTAPAQASPDSSAWFARRRIE